MGTQIRMPSVLWMLHNWHTDPTFLRHRRILGIQIAKASKYSLCHITVFDTTHPNRDIYSSTTRDCIDYQYTPQTPPKHHVHETNPCSRGAALRSRPIPSCHCTLRYRYGVAQPRDLRYVWGNASHLWHSKFRYRQLRPNARKRQCRIL